MDLLCWAQLPGRSVAAAAWCMGFCCKQGLALHSLTPFPCTNMLGVQTNITWFQIPQDWEICSLDKEGIPVGSTFWCDLLYVQVTHVVSCYWDTRSTYVSLQLLNLKELRDHRVVVQPFMHSAVPGWLLCLRLSAVTHTSSKHAPQLLREVSVTHSHCLACCS